MHGSIIYPTFVQMNKELKLLNDFFNKPGINKSGICSIVGVKQQYLNRVLNGTQNLTPKFYSRLFPVLIEYGYKE